MTRPVPRVTHPVPGSVTRVLVLGDPHGDVAGVRALLEAEVDASTLVVCVGDVVGEADGPSSAALCELLATLRVPTVLGNHDEQALLASTQPGDLVARLPGAGGGSPAGSG